MAANVYFVVRDTRRCIERPHGELTRYTAMCGYAAHGSLISTYLSQGSTSIALAIQRWKAIATVKLLFAEELGLQCRRPSWDIFIEFTRSGHLCLDWDAVALLEYHSWPGHGCEEIFDDVTCFTSIPMVA